jgi:hypothetical protein
VTTQNRDGLLPLTIFTSWLASGERGLSSDAIVSRLTGERVGRYSHGDHPWDLGDFRRCERLLGAVPLARMALPLMADVSPHWAALVEQWDEIAALDKTDPAGAYKRIRTALEGATQ